MTFASDIAAGLTEIREELGLAITYVRRNGNRISIASAVRTKPLFVSETSQGQARQEQLENWLIAAADLVDDSTTFLPRQGEIIEYDNGTTVLKFQLVPFAGDPKKRPFRLSDAAQSQYRINTTLIDNDPS